MYEPEESLLAGENSVLKTQQTNADDVHYGRAKKKVTCFQVRHPRCGFQYLKYM